LKAGERIKDLRRLGIGSLAQTATLLEIIAQRSPSMSAKIGDMPIPSIDRLRQLSSIGVKCYDNDLGEYLNMWVDYCRRRGFAFRSIV